jgi:putative membrane protein
MTLALAACAAPPPRVVTPPPPVAVQPPPTAPVPPSHPAAAFNDPQIIGIVEVANNIDIRLAELALRKSRNPQVRAFANEMIRDHSSLNNAVLGLAHRLGLRPEESSTTAGLIASANRVGSQLAQLNGRAFDRAYINNEVAYHQQVIGATNQVLIPSAHHPQLRAALLKARPIFVEHLRHAQRVLVVVSR